MALPHNKHFISGVIETIFLHAIGGGSVTFSSLLLSAVDIFNLQEQEQSETLNNELESNKTKITKALFMPFIIYLQWTRIWMYLHQVLEYNPKIV